MPRLGFRTKKKHLLLRTFLPFPIGDISEFPLRTHCCWKAISRNCVRLTWHSVFSPFQILLYPAESFFKQYGVSLKNCLFWWSVWSACFCFKNLEIFFITESRYWEGRLFTPCLVCSLQLKTVLLENHGSLFAHREKLNRNNVKNSYFSEHDI